MNANLPSMRRLGAFLATIAMLVAFAVTPVAAGEDCDDDEDCETAGGGGLPNTALQVTGPDYDAILAVVGGTSLLTAAGLSLATRKLEL